MRRDEEACELRSDILRKVFKIQNLELSSNF